MKRIECWIGAVAAAGGGLLLTHVADRPVLTASPSDVLLGCGVGVLGLGFVRDVLILAAKGRSACAACRVPRGVLVACAESVVGVLLIALGLACLLLRTPGSWRLGAGGLGVLAGGVLFASGLIKDRIVLVARKDDHREIIL